MNAHTAIALPLTVADIIEEYAAKIAAVDTRIAALETAIHQMKMASVVQGVYVENVVDDIHVSSDRVRLNLRKSGWKAVFSRMQIDRLASAKDKRLFEQTLADPPELTMENAKATFGDYLLRPRFHQLRALAECFVQLDPAYKSHSKVKIGVEGLPKRVILSSVGNHGSWGRERLRDIMNALATVSGLPLTENSELQILDKLISIFGNRAGEVFFDGRAIIRYAPGMDESWNPPDRGIKVRVFQNGNGHVIFNPETLRTVNRALAEFYGEVLPDMADDGETIPRPSAAVSKDLQYYPTPRAVIEAVLREIGVSEPDNRAWRPEPFEPKRVLEPSCGDGRFMDEIRARGHSVFGIEIDRGRVAQTLAKGHSVLAANFLETAADPSFDFVVMNPPFYGVHYRKHLAHARKFLKPGGALACILPASAWYDHGGLKGQWHDLPVASFAESGTNVPTGFIIIR